MSEPTANPPNGGVIVLPSITLQIGKYTIQISDFSGVVISDTTGAHAQIFSNEQGVFAMGVTDSQGNSISLDASGAINKNGVPIL